MSSTLGRGPVTLKYFVRHDCRLNMFVLEQLRNAIVTNQMEMDYRTKLKICVVQVCLVAW